MTTAFPVELGQFTESKFPFKLENINEIIGQIMQFGLCHGIIIPLAETFLDIRPLDMRSELEMAAPVRRWNL